MISIINVNMCICIILTVYSNYENIFETYIYENWLYKKLNFIRREFIRKIFKRYDLYLLDILDLRFLKISLKKKESLLLTIRITFYF